MIDPHEIHFIQNGYNEVMKNGRTVAFLASGLKNGSNDPAGLPPVRVCALLNDAIERDQPTYSAHYEQFNRSSRKALEGTCQRLEGMHAMREDGEISAAEFATRKAKYQNEIAPPDEEITTGLQRIHCNVEAIRKAVKFPIRSPERLRERSIDLR